MGQLLGFRHGLGRGAAQRRQLRFGDLAGPARGRSASLRLGERALGRGKLGSEVFRFALGSTPAREEQQRLVAADLLAEPAIALGLARLFLQRCEAAPPRVRDHIVEPGQIGLGRGELELGLAAAGVKPGGAGRVVQKSPAFGRLGLDQRADATLIDDRSAGIAAAGIGKQQLHVARARLAPVDPPRRAAAAIDTADNLDFLAVVEAPTARRRRCCRGSAPPRRRCAPAGWRNRRK